MLEFTVFQGFGGEFMKIPILDPTLIHMCAFYLNLDSLIPLKGGLSKNQRGGKDINLISYDRYIYTHEKISQLQYI